MSSARGLVLPVRALRVLGLSNRASLDEARRAHRALAFQLHPDVVDSSGSAAALQRTKQLVIANAAREAIELAARQGTGEWTQETRQQWDESTRRIHLSAMLGHWDEVLEALSLGVDPNVATPAQGAPPIFYAACCDFFGKASMGRGDEARLRVIGVLASNPAVNLSLKGKAMWADGRTVYDIVSMGRCHEAALESLNRGREATVAMLSQGMLYQDGQGAVCFAE